MRSAKRATPIDSNISCAVALTTTFAPTSLAARATHRGRGRRRDRRQLRLRPSRSAPPHRVPRRGTSSARSQGAGQQPQRPGRAAGADPLPQARQPVLAASCSPIRRAASTRSSSALMPICSEIAARPAAQRRKRARSVAGSIRILRPLRLGQARDHALAAAADTWLRLTTASRLLLRAHGERAAPSPRSSPVTYSCPIANMACLGRIAVGAGRTAAVQPRYGGVDSRVDKVALISATTRFHSCIARRTLSRSAPRRPPPRRPPPATPKPPSPSLERLVRRNSRLWRRTAAAPQHAVGPGRDSKAIHSATASPATSARRAAPSPPSPPRASPRGTQKTIQNVEQYRRRPPACRAARNCQRPARSKRNRFPEASPRMNADCLRATTAWACSGAARLDAHRPIKDSPSAPTTRRSVPASTSRTLGDDAGRHRHAQLARARQEEPLAREAAAARTLTERSSSPHNLLIGPHGHHGTVPGCAIRSSPDRSSRQPRPPDSDRCSAPWWTARRIDGTGTLPGFDGPARSSSGTSAAYESSQRVGARRDGAISLYYSDASSNSV